MTRKGTEPLTARADEALIPQSTVWLMAITVGVIVANIYYVQPLLADIARTFGLSVTRAGTVAMLSQAGTALGMFLFVPLGDKYERRSLIFILVLGSFGSLLLMGDRTEPRLARLRRLCRGRFCRQRACRRAVRGAPGRSAATRPRGGDRGGRNSFGRFARTHV